MTAVVERDPCFVADYRHLRDCGLSDDAIAARLGMSRHTLRQHIDRNGIRDGLLARIGRVGGAGGGACTVYGPAGAWKEGDQ